MLFNLPIHSWMGVCTHNILSYRAVRPRPGLGRIGKGEAGGVNDAIVAYQADGDLRRLAYPMPSIAKL